MEACLSSSRIELRAREKESTNSAALVFHRIRNPQSEIRNPQSSTRHPSRTRLHARRSHNGLLRVHFLADTLQHLFTRRRALRAMNIRRLNPPRKLMPLRVELNAALGCTASRTF